MLKPDQLREASDAISDSADRFALSIKSILITLLLSLLSIPVVFIGYNTYQYRDDILPLLYKALIKGQSIHTTNEWEQISPIDHPELYVCSRFTCQPDVTKKALVSQSLDRLLDTTPAIRVIFSLYAPDYTYRQIAAQVSRPGFKVLPRAYWTSPVNLAGYDSNVLVHQRDECNSLAIDSLPEGSSLRIGAKLFNTDEINTCPLNRGDRPWAAVGYVAIDLATPATLDEQAALQAELRKVAEELEHILGYDVTISSR